MEGYAEKYTRVGWIHEMSRVVMARRLQMLANWSMKQLLAVVVYLVEIEC